MKSVMKYICFILSSFVIAGTANSAPVTIDGTLFGSDFDLIYDDTATGLFGTPSLSNGTIFFAPSTFNATSTNGTGIDFTNSTIQMTIAPHAGKTFESFSLVERGDYILQGAGASVDVTGQIWARNTSGNPLDDTSVFITPTGSLSNQGTNSWEATAFIDSSTGNWKPLPGSGVLLTVENLLIANTAALGELAFIEKKILGTPISMEVTVVPLPGPLLLLLSGLIGFTFLRKKNS